MKFRRVLFRSDTWVGHHLLVHPVAMGARLEGDPREHHRLAAFQLQQFGKRRAMDGGEVVAGAFAEVDGAMIAKAPARRLGHLAIGSQLLFRPRPPESLDITNLKPPGIYEERAEGKE